MAARRVEFSLVISVIRVGVLQRRPQALELQAFEFVATRAQNRLHGHQLLDSVRTHRGAPALRDSSGMSRSNAGRRFSRAAANPPPPPPNFTPRIPSAR